MNCKPLFILFVLFVGCNSRQPVSLTILHTNDTHSQVEPREADNRGGYARRMGLIEEERTLDKDLILLDAGDFCQGTPYFNYYEGEVEISALNRMGYDAATLGNHEFDNGVSKLADKLREAHFPIVCANYVVDATPLEGIVKPYVILKRKGLKIGVIGLGVNPESLVAAENFAPLVWLPPFDIANTLAAELKQKKHCDVVICLSHLGTDVSHGDTAGICDINLAKQSRDIDVIIGGHTHREVNRYVENAEGRQILLVQTGKSGLNLGKITLTVE